MWPAPTGDALSVEPKPGFDFPQPSNPPTSLSPTPFDITDDVSLVGADKSRTHLQLLLLIFALVGLGTVMIYSASSGLAQLRFANGHFFIQRWTIRALIGLVAMLLVTQVDYRILKRVSKPLLLIGFLGLLTVLTLKLLGVGRVRGAYRWIPFPGGAFQPADLMRLALVIFLADSLNRHKGLLADFKHGYLPHVVVVALAMGMILLQPDLGTALAIGLTCALTMYVAGVRTVHLVGSGIAALPVIYLVVFVIGYRRERVMTFLNPTGDIQGDGYQISQSLLALGSGGLTGLGLGQSQQKYFFLPEPHTDFVFSILGEELGLIGTIGLLAAFVLFGYLGIKVARSAPDFHGFLLASGITSMVMVYAFVNMGVAIGLLPTTGLPLPFISYGGTSLLLTLIAAGILINIGKQGSLKTRRREERIDWNPSVSSGPRRHRVF